MTTDLVSSNPTYLRAQSDIQLWNDAQLIQATTTDGVMKLSSKEATILGAAELRPYASTQLLRKETGYREYTIRYAMHRLRTRGICVPLPFINLHKLGYTIFNIFFTISAQKRSSKDALLKAFAASPEVVWIGEFGGEYQYGIAVCTKQVGTALELINSLSAKYKNVFFDKAISVQYSATTFQRRYLSSKKFSSKPLTCQYTKEHVEIDELDDRILRTVATPGEFSNRQLAQTLGIPASTVDLRMRKLEEKGVIAGHLLAVDCTSFGYHPYKLLIYGKGINPDLSLELHKFCENHPNVTYMIGCLGNWDYEIGVEVVNSEEVTVLMQEIYEEFGAVVNTVKLLSKFRDIKFRWYPG